MASWEDELLQSAGLGTLAGLQPPPRRPRAAIPTPDELYRAARAKIIPEAPATQSALPAAPAAAPQGRTWTEAGADTLTGIGRMGAGMATGLANLADLATLGGVSEITKAAGGALDRALGGPGEGYTLQEGAAQIDQGFDALESAPLQAARQKLQARIAGAGQQGGVSGALEKAWEAAKGTATNPMLLGQMAAEQVPMLATMGLGTVGTAAKASNAARAAGLAPAAIEQAAQKAAVRSNIGFSGALGAGFSSQQAAQDIFDAPAEQLGQSPDYQSLLRSGKTDREARQALALQAGYPAAAVAGPVSALAARITAPLESRIFRGVAPTGFKAALAAAGREGLEEVPQESSEQIGTNLGVRQTGLDRGILEGVPESAGMAGVAGFLMGGALGGVGQIRASAGRGARAEQAVRSTDELRANLDFANEGEIQQAIDQMQALSQEGKLPKTAAAQVASGIKQLTDEMALRASPAALSEPMDNARGLAGYLGFSSRSQELDDEQIFEAANRAIPQDAPKEIKLARRQYQQEAVRRQSLNHAVAHFEQNPDAVAGVSEVLADIAGGKPLAKGAHGSTAYNVASLSDDQLTRYRFAAEILLRDHGAALGKRQKAVKQAVDLLHAEAQQRADNPDADRQERLQGIRESDIAAKVTDVAPKKLASLLDGLAPDAIGRMASRLEARAELEPALGERAALLREMMARRLESQGQDRQRIQGTNSPLGGNAPPLDAAGLSPSQPSPTRERNPPPSQPSPTRERNPPEPALEQPPSSANIDGLSPEKPATNSPGSTISPDARKGPEYDTPIPANPDYPVQVDARRVNPSASVLQRGLEAAAGTAAQATQQPADGAPQRQPGRDLAERPLEGELLPPEPSLPATGDLKRGWRAFPADSSTLGVPRSDMPQVKAEHRGALVNFLNARGITHESGSVQASKLKPTQAEFSPAKVSQALDHKGGERSILVSRDGYILDGHHQWLAAKARDANVNAIRLNAPIKQLIDETKQFPSAESAKGGAPSQRADQAERDFSPWKTLPSPEVIKLLPKHEIAALYEPLKKMLETRGHETAQSIGRSGKMIPLLGNNRNVFGQHPSFKALRDRYDELSRPKEIKPDKKRPTREQYWNAARDYAMTRDLDNARKARIEEVHPLFETIRKRFNALSAEARARRDAGEPIESINADLGDERAHGRRYLEWLKDRSLTRYVDGHEVSASSQDGRYKPIPEDIKSYAASLQDKAGYPGITDEKTNTTDTVHAETVTGSEASGNAHRKNHSARIGAATAATQVRAGSGIPETGQRNNGLVRPERGQPVDLTPNAPVKSQPTPEQRVLLAELPDFAKRSADFYLSKIKGVLDSLDVARTTDQKFGGGGRYAGDTWVDLKPDVEEVYSEIGNILASIEDPDNREAYRRYISDRLPESFVSGKEATFRGDRTADLPKPTWARPERQSSPISNTDKQEAGNAKEVQAQTKADVVDFSPATKPISAEVLTGYLNTVGWAEKGGQLLRDASGQVAGRTKWLPRDPWFGAYKAGGAGTLSESGAKIQLQRAIEGCPLSPKGSALVEFISKYESDHNAADEAIHDLSDDERALLADLERETAEMLGPDWVETIREDIARKVPDDAPQSDYEKAVMAAIKEKLNESKQSGNGNRTVGPTSERPASGGHEGAGAESQGVGPTEKKIGRSDYEERKAARIDRLSERASKLAASGNARVNAARNRASVIPFGQPILVGHHSERADRNYRAKIEQGYRKGFQQIDAAEALSRRVASAESNRAISADDPQALVKIREKIARLEEQRDKYKKINAAIRTGKDGDLKALGLSEANIAELKKPDFMGRVGIPSYELTNIGAEIRRLKQRSETVIKVADSPGGEWKGDLATVTDNPDTNRIEVRFQGKPHSDVLDELKRNGFKWSRNEKAWQRLRGQYSLDTAKRIAKVADPTERVDNPDARESRPASRTSPLTVEQARAQLADALGEKRVAALEKSGRLAIHAKDPTGTGAAGFVDPAGVIHLIPANMDQSAISVALHEAMHVAEDSGFLEGDRAKLRLAHAALNLVGVKNFIGNPGFTNLVQQAYRMAAEGNPVAREALDKARREAPHDVQGEFLAYLVQYAPENMPLVRRVLAAIRAAIYRMGVKVKLMPADVRALALSALKARAKTGNNPAPATRPAGPAYSSPATAESAFEQDRLWDEFQRVRAQFQERQPTEPAFRRWFGDGIEGVTSKNGKPITLYHGTKKEFYRFDPAKAGANSKHVTSGLGFFMTADKGLAARYGSRVLEIHAKLAKPYYFTDADLAGIETLADASRLRLKLASRGYDGGVITAPGAAPYVVAFESKQVKLTSNDAPTESEDFRYSKSAPREGSQTWANEAYANQEIPDGWYVHGRGGSEKLREDTVIQLTKDWEVAKFYGGTPDAEKGSIWLIKPKDQSEVLNFSSETTRDITTVADKAWEDFAEGNLPFEGDVVASLGENPSEEEFKDNIKRLLAPRNIVDSAGFFDGDANFINWLWDRFEKGFIETPDGAVALGTAFIDAVKIDKNIKIRHSMPGRPARWADGLPPEVASMAGKIGAEPKPLLERVKAMRGTLATRVRQGVVDKYARLLELDQARFGADAVDTDTALSAWVAAKMSKSPEGALESAFLHGELVWDKGAINVKESGKGLVKALEGVAQAGELNRFWQWIIANRAERLKAEGREHLFTDAEIAAGKVLHQGQMADGSDRATLYRDTFARYKKIQTSILDIAEQAGLFNQEQRQQWERDFYLPFYRVADDELDARGPTNGGKLVRQKAFEKLKGGTDKLGDPLQNILKNWHHLIDASLKNRAATLALDTAATLGIAQAVKPALADKTSVWIMKDGEKVHYNVADPLTLEAISAISAPMMYGPAVKALAAAKRALTLGVTISPAFKARNLSRDAIAAIAVSQLSPNALKNVWQGYGLAKEGSQTQASLLAGGGTFRFGTLLEGDRDAAAKRIAGFRPDTVLDTQEKMHGFLVTFKKGLDAWNLFGDRLESANRAALYGQMRKDGKTHLQASLAARDLMDFSQSGAWPAVRFLTTVVPFLNARIQGLDVLYRKGFKPVAKTVSGRASAGERQQAMRFALTTLAVSLASAALYLLFKDDDDFKKREQWDRDTYWWWKIGDTQFRFPKPFEVGAIGTLSERLLEQLVDENATGKMFTERMGAMLTQTFSMDPTPQLFKPLLEVYANKNSFTQRPIETPDMERLSPEMRRRYNTSALAVGMSEAGLGKLGVSPVEIEHLMRGYFGWMGAQALLLGDMVARPALDLPAKPTKLKDAPIFGDLLNTFSPDGRQSRYLTEFYEQMQVIRQVHADAKLMQKMGDTTGLQSFVADNRKALQLAGPTERVARTIADMNREEKRIANDRTLSGEEKQRRIDALAERKSRMARRVVETIR